MKRWTITAKYECTAYLLHGPLQRRVVDAPIYMMEGCSLRMTILGDDGPACKRPSIAAIPEHPRHTRGRDYCGCQIDIDIPKTA
jgi:hypothetical protein